MRKKVYVVSARRTAVGKIGGTLQNVSPADLLSPLIQNMIDKSQIHKEAIDEIIIGQAKQTQDQSNIARYAALRAGLPESLPGYTVHRQCGSGMQALHNAYLLIASGINDVVLAGGVESMSTAPYYLRSARFGYQAGNALLLDPNKESQPGSQPEDTYGRLMMGLTAENLAEEYRISRCEQDNFALRSQNYARQAIRSGIFSEEIVPVVVPQRKGQPIVFDTDEHPRSTSMEQLASLKPVFKPNGTVTAGNSSGLNDGAALLLAVSDKAVQTHQLTPFAEIVGLGVAGVAPDRMGIGPVEAARKALTMSGLELNQIGLIELNEAFAAQALAVMKELGLPEEKVNVYGGAIALGHPIGSSGARICVTLLHAMQRRKIRYGLATLCAAGGQGVATIFKRTEI